MADPTTDRYRGLILSATELQDLNPQWSDRMIEDYLELLRFLLEVANEVDEKNDIIKIVTNVDFTMSPYQILDDGEDIFYNTNGGDIATILPVGIEGRNFRLVNVGSSGNRVNITPSLAENIFGTTTEYMADQEAFLLTFDSIEGWN